MELIIDYDNIKDVSKQEFLLRTLKFLDIKFKTSGNAQTIEEYNQELEQANDEIEKGIYTTMADLLEEMRQW